MRTKESQIGRGSLAMIACAFSTLLVILPGGGAQAYERDETFQKHVPVQGEKRIVVANSRGEVRVIGEKGRTEVFCEFTKRVRGRSQEEADRLFDLLDVDLKREKGDLTISARYPDSSNRQGNILSYLMQRYAGLTIDMTVTVPAELDVKVVIASGDAQVASILGSVEIVSASGDVEVAGVGKDLKIDVSSGDLVASGVAGKAYLSSASGDIEAHHIEGDATVRSASGDVMLSEVGGDLAAASASGDVTVEGVGAVTYSGTSGSATFTGVRKGVTATVSTGNIEVHAAPTVRANYEIRTSSGGIELVFDAPVPGGFLLKAETTSGDISVDLPISVSKVGRHELAGAVREGKSVVLLETASGDITVNEHEE